MSLKINKTSKFPPLLKKKGGDKKLKLVICHLYTGWVNGTFEIYVASKKAIAIGQCRERPQHKNPALASLYK